MYAYIADSVQGYCTLPRFAGSLQGYCRGIAGGAIPLQYPCNNPAKINASPKHYSGLKMRDANPEHFCYLGNVSVQGHCWEDSVPERFGPNSLHATCKCSRTVSGRQHP